jgi:membrane-associated phospholipid phosphatase
MPQCKAGEKICQIASNAIAATGAEKAGDILQVLLPVSAAGLSLGLGDADGAWQLGKSLALTVGVTEVLKSTVHATRPNGGAHSFPSGHTSVAFSAAEYLRGRYGWQYGLPAYALATVVASSRVTSHQHYTRDVVAGAGIGMASSYVFTKPYKGWNMSAEGGVKHMNFKMAQTF